MTDQEAYLLIAENIQLLRETQHWGQITIEVKEGKVSRINLTIPLRISDHTNAQNSMKDTV